MGRILTILFTAVLLFGCGGGDKKSSNPDPLIGGLQQPTFSDASIVPTINGIIQRSDSIIVSDYVGKFRGGTFLAPASCRSDELHHRPRLRLYERRRPERYSRCRHRYESGLYRRGGEKRRAHWPRPGTHHVFRFVGRCNELWGLAQSQRLYLRSGNCQEWLHRGR